MLYYRLSASQHHLMPLRYQRVFKDVLSDLHNAALQNQCKFHAMTVEESYADS
jgi:hypothetical protein